MSDIYDNLLVIRKVVEFFNERNVDLVIYVGDYVVFFVVREFKKFKVFFKGVFGNNDGERKGFYEVLGIYDELIEFEVDGMKIVVMYGMNEVLVKVFVYSRFYDVVVVGYIYCYEI